MALTMSHRIVMRGIGCTLTLLFVLPAQAIDYEVYRHDLTPTKLRNDTISTNRDYLERLNLVAPKTRYTLQESTEHLLLYGALLRARFLDTFGNLLYIHYDDFSVAEVDALHNVYRATLERRYNIFDLVPDILQNRDARPSRICAGIYAHSDSCLRDSANVCRRIRKQHDRPHPDDDHHLGNDPASNVTRSMYRTSRLSKQYPRGFSLSTLLKLLQKEVLAITPGLLSGLLYNVRYDSFDDDVRVAERELVRFFDRVARRSTELDLAGVLEPLSIRELKKFRSIGSFLKYYIDIHAERLPDDNLRRYALLIARHIVGEVGTIDENIHLLGHVYEDKKIHIRYLFDLVLPDDILNEDVVEAKRYLTKKLNEFDVVERYLKVEKYQQATPAHLVMEITGQLKEIGFARDIAAALHVHARFWRSSRMIESLDELLVLFDAYENLRRVPRYREMMGNIDTIRKSLRNTRDVTIEILCNAPRACLRIGLRTVLHCRFVNSAIKGLIRDFLKQVTPKGALSSEECETAMLTPDESKHSVSDISFKVEKVRVTTKTTDAYPGMETEGLTGETAGWITGVTSEMTKGGTTTAVGETSTLPAQSSTTEEVDDRDEVIMAKSATYQSGETHTTVESDEISGETTERFSIKTESSTEESTEFTSSMTTGHEATITPIFSTTIKTPFHGHKETTETTSTIEASTVATTTATRSSITTISPISATASAVTTSPATTTTSPSTATILPTTTTNMRTATPYATTSSTFTTTTSTATITPMITTTLSTTKSISSIDMDLKQKLTVVSASVLGDEHLNVTSSNSTIPVVTVSKSCESDECDSEPDDTEETVDELSTTSASTTQALTPTTTTTTIGEHEATITEAFTSSENTRTTSSEHPSTEEKFTGKITTEPSAVPKGDGCVSCSKKCARSNSESAETPGCYTPDCSSRPCSGEDDCDSLMEECEGGEEDSEDTSAKSANLNVECSRMRCEEESPEMPSGCETSDNGEASCEGPGCSSNGDVVGGSAECAKVCVTREDNSSSSCEDMDDCATATDNRPSVDTKHESTRNRGLCEIRDPHHRRQLKRLAKMRAISAATSSSSRSDVLRSRSSRLRGRIATKKLYNLLAARSPPSENGKAKKLAEYSLKRPLGAASSRIDQVGRKQQRRQQRDQIYRLRKELERRLDRKPKTGGRTANRSRRVPASTHPSQSKRISRGGARSIVEA